MKEKILKQALGIDVSKATLSMCLGTMKGNLEKVFSPAEYWASFHLHKDKKRVFLTIRFSITHFKQKAKKMIFRSGQSGAQQSL